MKATEKNYAIARVSELCRDKIGAVPNPVKSLSLTDKLELIASGKVKLKTKKEILDSAAHYYGTPVIDSVFDFSKFEIPCEKAKLEYDNKLAEIRRKAQSVKDEIMLGDEQRALKLLRNWSADSRHRI